MHAAIFDDVLTSEGFRLIGRLNHRLHLSVWWHAAAEKLMELTVLSVGPTAVIRGGKSYYLTSITADGETWSRDIGPLQNYLEAHFPEMRLSFSHFRDVPRELAEREVRRRMAVEAPSMNIPNIEQVATLQHQFQQAQRRAQSTNRLLSLSAGQDLLTGYDSKPGRSKPMFAHRRPSSVTNASDLVCCSIFSVNMPARLGGRVLVHGEFQPPGRRRSVALR